MKKIIGWIVGKVLKGKLNLEEGTPMENNKSWYKSKTVWTGIVTVLVGTYETVNVALAPSLGWSLPQIPPIIYTILGSLGIYSRVVAKKTISG